MIRIILVDDEFYIRERLKIMVDWNAMGFEIVGEAENGEEALAVAEALRPDAVFADIKMPRMDGLALAAELQRLYPHIFTVILTGYNLFEYARQAIRYGVSGYLLKPINVRELTEQLEVLAEQVQARKKTEHHLLLSQEAQADEAINCLLFEPDTLQEKPPLLPAAVSAHSFLLALVRFQEQRITRDFLHNIMNLLKEQTPCVEATVFHTSELTVGLLLRYSDTRLLTEMLPALNSALAQSYKDISHFGASERFSHLSQIREAYRQALAALREGIFLSEPVVYYSQVATADEAEKLPLQGLREQLLVALRNGDAQQLRQLVQGQFSLLLSSHRAYYNLTLLVHELLGAAVLYDERPEVLSAGEFLEGYHRIQDVQEWAVSYFTSLCQSKSHQKTTQQVMVQQARELIEKLYSVPDCSLDYIAKRMNCNPNYLSNQFKKHTGLGVVQYITNCRMEKARQLLLERSGKLADICEAVGYNDVSYFSRRFKQYYGTSPSHV